MTSADTRREELVEVVARAICKAANRDPDEMTYQTMAGECIQEPYGPMWTRFIDEATAALDALTAAGVDLEGEPNLKDNRDYWRENCQALEAALHGWPKMPSAYICARTLSQLGVWPEDWERGKRIQREFGSELIPYKTECEQGAGFWDRITNGAWRPLPTPPKDKTNG